MLWLDFNKWDIEVEKQQCIDEGRDIKRISKKFDRIINELELAGKQNQLQALELLDETQKLPLKKRL